MLSKVYKISIVLFCIILFGGVVRAYSFNQNVIYRNIRNVSKADLANHGSRIASTIGAKVQDLRDAIKEGNEEALKKEIDAYEGKVENLELGEVNLLKKFKESTQYEEYIEKAEKSLLNGNYVSEMFFAGAATRLYESIKEELGKDKADELAGPMYFVDIWSIVEALEGKDQVSNHAIKDIGMGPRQLLQLNTKLTKLAKENGRNPNEVLSNQKIVLHINSEIKDEVEEDLINHDFYGFNPDNVVILVQPVLPGYEISEGNEVKLAEDSNKFPYGHGYATEQLINSGEAYTINSQGNENYIEGNVLEYVKSKGAKLMGTHRINDLTKFDSTVVDTEKLAYSLNFIENKDSNIVVELVSNPEGQKGGLFLKNKSSGKQFLLEGISSETEAIQDRLDELTKKIQREGQPGIPYNAFRLVYDFKNLSSILSNGIPNNIRVRGEENLNLYLELVTGDITTIEEANSVGIMNKGEEINDFKKKADLPSAITALTQQDSQELFRDAVKEYIGMP